MTWYNVQLFFLMLVAVFIGLFIGCRLRAWWEPQDAERRNVFKGLSNAFSGGAAKLSSGADAVKDKAADAKADAAKAKAAAEAKAKSEAKKASDAAKKAKDEAAAKAKAAADAAKKKAADAKDKAADAAKSATAKVKDEAKAVAKSATTKVKDLTDEEAAERLAALPEDATPEQKADAVGARPAGLVSPDAGGADDLKRIRGIGKVNEKKLNDLGIYHFRQVAAWTGPETRWVGTFLAFAGRIEREDWIGQAKVLAEGGDTDFSKRVDDGDVPTSKG
ncbi:hypothetical protein [Rhodobium gokarnense]|uniref:Flap endonuclease-1-like 5' DNA nuclease n=1 Tax=Rhodobium gokarnense TaxID=364296 RepID=A0ABT3HG30_9HYPH|nr:hypothetical protein [Rhodobium gokarnense]MCW2309353.1 putative flap endonuclease-1-like 5' DNA nuclease [Rhodobium gokarnense]